MVLAAEHAGKLVHDPAFHTYKLIFRLLGQLDHGHWIHFQAEKLIQGKGRGTFESGRGGHAGSKGNIPPEYTIKAPYLRSQGLDLLYNTQNIVRPMKGRRYQFTRIAQVTKLQVQRNDM